MKKASNSEWWRGGVLYQIYPRSFMDSNGDGIGDLPGITERLPHIAELGVDGIWLSPFFKSPMKDFGYDVSDYCDVDPMFGTLDDFRKLVVRAHQLGLKVTIDQVLSHTSDQHPWFIESRSSRDNPRADWYVWADAKPDGTPPNNWLSIFGGSAWQWDTRRCQYYLHNFLTSQPDLNFHNPAVQDALLAAVRFWLDLGVDGFRLDTANFYVHDKELRNNPAKPKTGVEDPAVNAVNPYGWQQHLYDKSRPENILFLNRLRALVDEYPDTTMVGEIGCDTGLFRAAEYTRGEDRLHMAYGFDLLAREHGAPYLHKTIATFLKEAGESWICWSLSNHDVTRVATRWADGAVNAEQVRMALGLLLALRGTPCLYQGDELGLTEAEVPYELLQDPYGITMWPEFKGRDGCRTPMPWEGQPGGGFSTAAKPWLPIPQDHLSMAVSSQKAASDSLLGYTQKLLAQRKARVSLVKGEMTLLPLDPRAPQVLAFERRYPGKNGMETTLCVFNCAGQRQSYVLPQVVTGKVFCGNGVEAIKDDRLELAPYGFVWFYLA